MSAATTLPEIGEGSDPHLLEALHGRILRHGPLSFAEFMELALYHPEWGYYSRPEDPVGPQEGRDYYTAPSRHPAFGALIGRQVAQCLALVGGARRSFVEFGPGSGTMAASILAELRAHGLGPASGLQAVLVEANPHRREAQERLLRAQGLSEGVRWVTPAQWSQSTETLRGCILANEVLDALPVHRLRWEQGEVQEMRVGWDAGPVEIWGGVTDTVLLGQSRRECPGPREGQEWEVGLEAKRWVGEATARLERGYVVILDYGHLAPEIHSPRHHRGTLVAYHRHRFSEAYLERVGRQDLTAHVNFSTLLDTACRAGLKARGPIPQGRMLMALGAMDFLVGGAGSSGFTEYRERQGLQDLILPGGMGESHHAVVLATQGCSMDLIGLRPPARWSPPPEA